MPGIGKLVLVHRKERLGRNPKTGETITISGKDRREVPRRKGPARNPFSPASAKVFICKAV